MLIRRDAATRHVRWGFPLFFWSEVVPASQLLATGTGIRKDATPIRPDTQASISTTEENDVFWGGK